LLSRLRHFALENSAFYRLFHRGLANRALEDLPVLTKSILMENFDRLVTDRNLRLAEIQKFLDSEPGPNLFRGRYVVLMTSGTTGSHGVFVFNPGEWITVLANVLRPVAWASSGGPGSGPRRAAIIASANSWHHSARVASSLATPSLLHLDAAEPLDHLVRRLNDWQPEFLTGYPPIIRLLAEEQIAGRLHLNVQRVATSAAVLTGETRARVREAWKTNICDSYNATEYSPIAAECPLGNKHLFEDGAIIEIVDGEGRAVPPGTCGERVLLTVFARRTQPLIRYEITDRVRPAAGECGCGRKLQLIEDVEGRVRDVLRFPAAGDGKEVVLIYPTLFYAILDPVATGWQLMHDQNGLWVSLTGVRDPSRIPDIAQAVRMTLESRGAQAPPIHVREVAAFETGATGKVPLVLSRIPNRTN